MINLSHILEDLAKILIKTGVLKLSFYFFPNKLNDKFKNIYYEIRNFNFLISAACNL